MIPYLSALPRTPESEAYLNLTRRDWTFETRTIAEGRFYRYTQDFEMKIEFVIDLDI